MRSSFFLILSVFVHALAIAAIAISPSQIAKPEGQEIEVQIGTAAEVPGVEAAPAGVTTPVAAEVKPVEPKPLKFAKASTRKTRVVSAPMEKVTELPQKEAIVEKSDDKLDPQIEVASQPDFKPVVDAAPAGVEASDENTEASGDDGKGEDPTPAPAAAPAATGKSEDSNSESELAHGGATKAGAISYLDLKQNPGNKSPMYPLIARREARQGQVELLYRVTKEGKVSDLQIVKSSGHKDLDLEAARAVAQFKFVPGQEGWARHPVAFSLKGMASQAPSKLRNAQTDN